MSAPVNAEAAAIGARVRARRLELGLSQSALGELIDVTFQQIQKYERGANWLSSARILQLARALAVEPAWFFGEPGAPAPRLVSGGEARGVIELLDAYRRLDPDQQRAVRRLCRALRPFAEARS